MQSHICKVHVYLAVTSHLHFWQNDRGPLHATVVTRGWNRYWNKSQHRKLTLENKILPPAGSNLQSWSQVRCCNHWTIPAFRLCMAGSASWAIVWQLGMGAAPWLMIYIRQLMMYFWQPFLQLLAMKYGLFFILIFFSSIFSVSFTDFDHKWLIDVCTISSADFDHKWLIDVCTISSADFDHKWLIDVCTISSADFDHKWLIDVCTISSADFDHKWLIAVCGLKGEDNN